MIVLALVGLESAQARAQIAPLIPGTAAPEATIPERQSVGERPIPEYAAIGGQFGDFVVFPTLDVSELYNSNMFATETNQKSDFGTFVDPAIAAQSNWNRNALNFLATGDIRRYANQVSENESNLALAANGRLDVLEGIYFTGALGYEYLHEERTSPDTVTNQKTPTAFQLVSGRLAYVHDVGIVGLKIDTGVDWYTYDNNVTSTGISVPETGRNRVEFGITPRVTYELAPGYHAFIQTPLNLRQYQAKYDLPPTAGGFKRSSKGYEVDVGTAFALTSLINGEVYIGYLDQEYDDPRLASASGPSFGGNLLWNPTQLTSIGLKAARSVEETTIAPASSFIQSQVGLSLEHSLRRNVLLTAGVSYTDQDYQGLARDDNIYAISAGGRYLLNQYLAATLNANYQTRISNVSPNTYRQTTILAGLRLQY